VSCDVGTFERFLNLHKILWTEVRAYGTSVLHPRRLNLVLVWGLMLFVEAHLWQSAESQSAMSLEDSGGCGMRL
jgi:hypothetical protein